MISLIKFQIGTYEYTNKKERTVEDESKNKIIEEFLIKAPI